MGFLKCYFFLMEGRRIFDLDSRKDPWKSTKDIYLITKPRYQDLDQERIFTSPRIVRYVLNSDHARLGLGKSIIDSSATVCLPASTAKFLVPSPSSCEVIFDPSLRGLSGLVGELDVQQGLRQGPGSAVIAAGGFAWPICRGEQEG